MKRQFAKHASDRVGTLLLVGLLAGCGLADPDTRYPASPDQAKQARNTYATPREVYGSLIDVVPAAGKALGTREAPDPASPRLGWRIYGDREAGQSGGQPRSGLPGDAARSGERDERSAALAPERAGSAEAREALWRASLDAVATMPIQKTDPAAGVILTDWYELPKFPGQRVKVSIYVVGDRLARDALRVSVIRQQRDDEGNWRDVPAAPDSILELERRILIRAADFLKPSAPSASAGLSRRL